MMRTRIFIFIFIILCGTITNLCGGCKPQEPSKLTIVIEGKELSDAEIFIDEKPAGRLTKQLSGPMERSSLMELWLQKCLIKIMYERATPIQDALVPLTLHQGGILLPSRRKRFSPSRLL
jgi:hypothetical protein